MVLERVGWGLVPGMSSPADAASAGAGSAGRQRQDPLLTGSGAMGTAAATQVVDQRQSARSYGLGGIAAASARLHGRTKGNEPQIRPLWAKPSGQAISPRSHASLKRRQRSSQRRWCGHRPGKESEPLPLSSSGFAPPPAVGTSWPKAALSCGWRSAQAHEPG